MVTTRRQARISGEKVAENSNTKDHRRDSPVPSPVPLNTRTGETQPYEWPSSPSAANLDSQNNHRSTETEGQDADETFSEAEEEGEDAEINQQSESERQATPRGRGKAWQPWEDRILAKEVLAQKAFDPPYGQTKIIWERIAQIVTNANQSPVNNKKRTAKACRERWQHLVKCHREQETRAMQATGTDEEIDDHVQTMTEAVQLIDDLQLQGEKASESAKLKAEKERQAGIEMRRAAMQNMVRREELTDVANLETATVRERQAQRKRPAPMDDPNKENTDTMARPTKKRATFQATMTTALREHQEKEKEALDEARRRGDAHHAEMQASLGRLENSIDRLGDAIIQNIEQQQRSQNLVFGMIAGSSTKQ